MTVQALQDVYDELNRRAGQKLAELVQAERAVRDLTSRIIDASEAERQELIEERVWKVGHHDLLLAEYNELQARADAALLAVREFQVELARGEFEARWNAAAKAWKARDAAGVELRSCIDGERARLPICQIEGRKFDLRQKAAQLQAQAEIAGRELDRARLRLEIEIEALNATRGELGIGKEFSE